jgi:hypothetical protein
MCQIRRSSLPSSFCISCMPTSINSEQGQGWRSLEVVSTCGLYNWFSHNLVCWWYLIDHRGLPATIICSEDNSEHFCCIHWTESELCQIKYVPYQYHSRETKSLGSNIQLQRRCVPRYISGTPTQPVETHCPRLYANGYLNREKTSKHFEFPYPGRKAAAC